MVTVDEAKKIASSALEFYDKMKNPLKEVREDEQRYYFVLGQIERRYSAPSIICVNKETSEIEYKSMIGLEGRRILQECKII